MNAYQKIAWTELIVSVTAIAVVVCLLPRLGHHASSGFALLGAVALAAAFARKRSSGVTMDERDRAIEARASNQGTGAAWMFTFLALIALVFWSSFNNDSIVPARYLSWVIWIQFAICYAVKGLCGVLAYRGQTVAS